jgi:hypothetical protein
MPRARTLACAAIISGTGMKMSQNAEQNASNFAEQLACSATAVKNVCASTSPRSMRCSSEELVIASCNRLVPPAQNASSACDARA